MSYQAKDKNADTIAWLGLVMLFALLMSCYFVARYQGRWIDTDTSVLSTATTAMQSENSLTPAGYAYKTGYVYQLICLFLTTITGVSIGTLQALIFPIAGAVFGSAVIFILFREYLGSPRYAALATILLYAHPDFSFVSLRGSHEKLTWPLAAMSVFLLLRSYKLITQQRKFVVSVVVFYVCIYTLITTNFFFASSFALALFMSLIMGNLWGRVTKTRLAIDILKPVLRRYLYLVASSLVLLAIVMLYTYPPVGVVLKTMRGVFEKTSALFLSYQGSELHDTYSVITYGWVDQKIYLFLTLINYFLILTSVPTLLVIVFKRKYQTRERLMLALFYVAFSLQIVAGIAADFTGSLGANFQLRLLPAFLLTAIPMSVTGLKLLMENKPRYGRVVAAALPVLLVIFTVNAMLKATNEPLVSNYWTFYSVAEDKGLQWSNRHLQNDSLWLEYDAIRLNSLWGQNGWGKANAITTDAGPAEPETRNFFVSDTTRRWNTRQRIPLPMPSDAMQVYDNGEAQLYRLRPLTPYQK